MVPMVVVVLAGPVPMAGLAAAVALMLQELRVPLLAVVVAAANTTAVRVLHEMAPMVPPARSALPTRCLPR